MSTAAAWTIEGRRKARAIEACENIDRIVSADLAAPDYGVRCLQMVEFSVRQRRGLLASGGKALDPATGERESNSLRLPGRQVEDIQNESEDKQLGLIDQ